MRKKRRRKFKRFNFKLNPGLIWAGVFFIFFVVFFFGLGHAIYTSAVFKVKEENIKSNVDLDKALKDKIRGRLLFNVDMEFISSYLLKKYPEYKKVRVTKRPPSAVIIEVEKRKYFAQIKAKKFYPVDREAVILTGGSPRLYEHLIPVEISSYNCFFSKGYRIKDKRLECAFDLIEVLNEEMRFFDDYTIKLINSTHLPAVYFDIVHKGFSTGKESGGKNIKIKIGEGNFRQKISRLKDVINQELRDKIFLVNYIDLRFKKIYVDFRR